MKSKTGLKSLAAAVGFASVMTLGGAIKASAEDVVLHMAVPDWPPTRIMKEMFDKEYKPASGNKVTLDLDFIPWPDFYTRVNASLTSGEKKYNMAVSDSQWLGAFIEGGYFRKINDLIDADPDLKKAMGEMHPAILNAYATYPYTSKNYYGFPQFHDILVSYARKDIFCNDQEQKNFKAKYNKKLPCTGEEFDNVDWQVFENIGEFFLRKKGDMLAGKPADADFYGIAFQVAKGYDFSTTSVHTFVCQAGGNIWDETKIPDGHAQGVVNSDVAVKALDHMLSLIKYMPPVAKTGTDGHFQIR
jgi:multiple sugar transport system substrate-binding protein